MANASSVNADLTALLRARNSLLLVRTDDEFRFERAMVSPIAANAKYEVRFWDCSTGITDAQGKVIAAQPDPNQALNFIRTRKERAVYVLRDLHKWFDPIILRSLRSIARELKTVPPAEARAIVLLSPVSMEIPRDVPEMTTIDYPLPDREEVGTILTSCVTALPEGMRDAALPEGARDRAIDSALGLSALQIENSYSRSLVTPRAEGQPRTIDPALVAGEKKRIIAGIPGVTWHDADPRGLDAIGGLDVLKQWLTSRRAAFTPRARAFGLPAPKGVMLCGLPGTGKSLAAKCIATAFGVPLMRLDIGGTKSKYVGDSESNIRRALSLAETVAPCVLWVDEVEKALGGASGPQGDGGVSADALGVLLSWMQEKTAPVFVVATANDVRALPPELLRKGRFDDLFFVDLPTFTERKAIVMAAMAQYGRDGAAHADAVAAATDGFTGAEIAAIVPDALFVAFAADERPIETADLLLAAEAVVPLSKTASERIGILRDWAKGRARYASTPESTVNTVRSLDL